MNQASYKPVWSVRRPFKFAFGAVVALGVVAFGIQALLPLFRHEETLEEAAWNCLSAVESGDVRGVMRYLRKDEISLLELDYEKLDSLLNGFVRPRLQGFKPKGDPEITPGSILRIRRTYSHPDGREVSILLFLTETDDGPRLWYGISHLADLGIATYPTEGSKGVADPFGLFLYKLSKALPDLERLELRQVAEPADPQAITLKALTWREYARERIQDWERTEKRRWPH